MYIENIVIGKPIVEPSAMFAADEDDWNKVEKEKTYFGYCNADDADVERCPYLKAIEEIARLSVENSQLEDDLK